MKQIFVFAVILCISFASVFQTQAVNFIPESGAKYYIVATGTSLAIGGLPTVQPNVNNVGKLASQRFEFIPVSGLTDTYYLKNDTAYYLGKWSGNAWSTTYTTTTNGTSSEWVIDGTVASSIRLKVNASGYIGYNSATDRPLWCDKNNTFATGVFKLIKTTDMIQNDIIDGGFENADAEGTPIGVWINDLGKTYGGGTKSRIQTSSGYESVGVNSFLLKFLGTSDGDSYNSISTKLTSLIPGATYQLSFKYKQSISSATDATTRVFAAANANAAYTSAIGSVFTTTPPTDVTSAQPVSTGTITFVAPSSTACYLVFAKTISTASYNQNIDDLVLTKTADPNPIITTSASYLVFDEVNTTGSFNVTGYSLTNPIAITTPAGITVDQSSLSATVSGIKVNVTYDGVASENGYITLTSGTTSTKIRVKASKNTDCFTKLYPTLTNIITDPYFNSLSTYAGWGSKSIISDTTIVFCGSSCVTLTGACGASLDYSLTGKLTANTTYRFKAMVNSNAELSFTLNGCGINGSTADYQQVSNTSGVWQAIDFSFTTGTLASAQNLWINSCSGTNRATTSYLDNMELYNKSLTTKIENALNNQNQRIYVNNNQIVADFNLEQSANIEFLVYNTQGLLLSKEKASFEMGKTQKLIKSSLPSGVYLVTTICNGKFVTQKIII
jgi:hypothetical protein